LYGRFILGDARHEFLVGAGYVEASANRRDYGYNGWHGLARLNYRMGNGFVISPLISFSQDFYDGSATALETSKRQDDRLRIGAELSYPLSRAWSLEAAYYYVNTNSTSSLYSYDQHVVSLGSVWRF
jgi:hypothetical protein